MSAERSIEVSGDSIEDAIAKGLSQLGVGPAEVIVEVLEEPKPAMFGMDPRPARVRLQLLGLPSMPPPAAPAMPSAPPPSPRPQEPRAPEPRREREPRERTSEEPRQQRRPPQQGQSSGSGQGQPRREGPPRRRDDRGFRERDDRQPVRRGRDREQEILDSVEEEIDDSLPFVHESAEIPENQLDEEAQVAKVVLNELLERMDIRARIVVRRSAPDDQSGAAPYILDIMSSGNSGRLVGRKGETLAALQYITRLITSRELQRRADVIVDANSYKARRAQSLTTLAQRMADEAVSGNKTVTLEPMPPHERRIVHLALRAREDVSTRSVGEGTARKVTIVPNKQAT